MKAAKLDMYAYTVTELDNTDGLICIYFEFLDLADVADIAADITQANGNIYLEGKRYKMVDMRVIPTTSLEILVRENKDERQPRNIEANC